MDIDSTIRARVGEEAVDWFSKFQGEPLTAADRQAFSEWLMRSPLHIEEYLAVSATWETLDIPQQRTWEIDALIEAARAHDPQTIIPLRQRALPAARHAVLARPRSTWVALAAGLALVGCGLLYFHWRNFAELETMRGELRSVVLADGSVVFLNTDSRLQVRFKVNERRIDLLKGEARFQVARNPARPFVVVTSDAAVRAVGTIFNVRVDAANTQVAVIEGRVKVSARPPATVSPLQHLRAMTGTVSDAVPPPSSIELNPGERAAVTPATITRDVGATVETVTAWPERRLVFRDESLVDVVADFNRYRVQPLIIDDPELAALKISGVFDSGDPDSLMAYLKSFEAVRTERTADGVIHLSRSANAQKFNE